MKRSEAIELIYKTVDDISYSQCEEVLKVLEQAGMSPPDDLGIVFGWNEGNIQPPEWEPERSGIIRNQEDLEEELHIMDSIIKGECDE